MTLFFLIGMNAEKDAEKFDWDAIDVIKESATLMTSRYEALNNISYQV